MISNGLHARFHEQLPTRSTITGTAIVPSAEDESGFVVLIDYIREGHIGEEYDATVSGRLALGALIADLLNVEDNTHTRHRF